MANRGNRGPGGAPRGPSSGDTNRVGGTSHDRSTAILPRRSGPSPNSGQSGHGLGRNQGRGGSPHAQGGGQNRGRGSSRGPRGNSRGGQHTDTQIFVDEDSGRPDLAVHRIEDTLVRNSDAPRDAHMARRPSYGRAGTPINVFTNYYRIIAQVEKDKPDSKLFRYSVAFPDTVKLNKYQRRHLIETLLQGDRMTGIPAATDYAGVILTTKAVSHTNESWSGTLDTRQSAEGGSRSDNNTVKFTVELNGVFSFAPILQALKSTTDATRFSQTDEILQILNILFGYFAGQSQNEIYQIGLRNKFYHGLADARSNLGEGLYALKGFIASARPATGRLLLNLNVINGAFFKPDTLLRLVKEISGIDRPERLTQTHMRKLESRLKLIRVEICHLRRRDANGEFSRKADGSLITDKKIKTIRGFSRTEGSRAGAAHMDAKTLYFTNTDQKTGQTTNTSVYQHFSEHYPHLKAQLNDNRGWPLCNLGNTQFPNWVPLSFCTVLPGQAVRRLLERSQAEQMIKFAAKSPAANLTDINLRGLDMFSLRTEAAQSSTLEPFGLTVNPHPIQTPARILEAPNVIYQARSVPVPVWEGSWNLADQVFATPACFSKFAVTDLSVALKPSRRPEQLQAIAERFGTQLRNYGIQYEHCVTYTVDLPGLEEGLRPRVLDELTKHFHKMFEDKVSISLVILPEKQKWLYSRVKFYGDVVYGIPSVCIWTQKLMKYDPGTIANIAMKFNIKMGGINHKIELKKPAGQPPVLAPLDRTTMLMGIDVTHPSPGSATGSPSIAAVVASVDEHLAQWPVSLKTQEGKQEIVDKLEGMVAERLQRWCQCHNNQLPEQVIVYRDGVSEGQYQIVVDEEISKIKRAFQSVYLTGKSPKLSFIVVGKRHHTRFYPTSIEHSWKNGNCKPGLVVDRGVTTPYTYDFFLQSHRGIQGTAKPAHYVVAMDEIGMTADVLQRFTFHLCHMFNRSTMAVSVCPPAYYADLACERARLYMYNTFTEPGELQQIVQHTDEWKDRQVHPALRGTTFYI